MWTPKQVFHLIESVEFLIQSAKYQNDKIETMAKTQEELDSKLDELNTTLAAGLQALSDHLAILQKQVNDSVASAAAKTDLQPEFDKAQAMIDKIKAGVAPTSEPAPPVVVETPPSEPTPAPTGESNAS